MLHFLFTLMLQFRNRGSAAWLACVSVAAALCVGGGKIVNRTLSKADVLWTERVRVCVSILSILGTCASVQAASGDEGETDELMKRAEKITPLITEICERYPQGIGAELKIEGDVAIKRRHLGFWVN